MTTPALQREPIRRSTFSRAATAPARPQLNDEPVRRASLNTGLIAA